MSKKVYFLLLLYSVITLLSSCVDEISKQQTGGIAYLQIKGATLFNSNYPPNAELDDKIVTLRIMAFDAVGVCVSNKRYDAARYDIIKHEINKGTYDFVFVANEPYTENASPLNGISNHSNLENISFPESTVNSSDNIPMVQEIKNVEVLGDNGKSKVDGIAHDPLELSLSRLATRIDILLEANENLTPYFKGVTFEKIPKSVPLMSENNGSVARDITRTFTVDESYFTTVTPSDEQKGRGVVWVKAMTRFILPFSNFTPTKDENKAVNFTVNMENKYSPSAKLKIETAGVGSATEDNYTLPRDAALFVKASVKLPFELNIEVSDWGERKGAWQVQDRYLNVSQIEADITDFNGARITFSSNMPVVKVLPTVSVNNTAQTMNTENVFNDLIPADGETSTTRFAYTYDPVKGEGTGYMDILMDEYNLDEATFGSYPNGRHTTFGLTLSAENEDGSNPLQREIKVNTSQYGIRWIGNQWNFFAYMGAFFRDNEMGERIISMQLPRMINQNNQIGNWEVRVDGPYKDLIILSTTPSFDPHVGTDNPGNPENYPVRPNEYKQEEVNNDGTIIKGKGRVYFRVGWRSENTSLEDYLGEREPRYATISLTHTVKETEPGGWQPEYKIYLRQGEGADYFMDPTTSIDKGPLKGQTRNFARKISPFNLTDPDMKDKGESYSALYVSSSQPHKGVFVSYPTQAGAFYQWGLDKTNTSLDAYRFRAYHPSKPAESDYPTTGYWANVYPVKIPMWSSSGSDTSIEYGYGSLYENCPKGYHRPSDGYNNQTSYNGLYPNFKSVDNPDTYLDYAGNVITPTDYSKQIESSEWRQSLWKNPWPGETVSGTTIVTVGKTSSAPKEVYRERTAPIYKNNQDDISLTYGFYADGFFDRRPIKLQKSTTNTLCAVAVNTPSVAYRGTLAYNKDNDVSVFFPGAGRRRNESNGALEFSSETAYYWSSSMAPSPPSINTDRHSLAAWAIEINNFENTGPGHVETMATFGLSIRCVRDVPPSSN